MTRRLRWTVLLALTSCYFETPTHGPDNDAASEIDPVGGDYGGMSESEGSMPSPDAEMGTTDPGDAGTSNDATTTADGGMDAEADCACTGGKLVCIPSTGACVECNAQNKNSCIGDRPVCDLSTSTCVGCTLDVDCPTAAKAKCDTTTHACVPCDAKGQCAHVSADLKVCNAGACTQCSASDPAACTGAGSTKPFCGTTTNVCVACNTNQDCTDPTKPTCEGNVCRACRNEADCSGKSSGATTLDACYNGQCVDCRVSTTNSKLDIGCTGSVSCNPATRTCTGRTKGSLSICQACVADAECVPDHRCIAMYYRTTSVGGYCMKIGTPGACAAPYTARPLTRASLSGAPSDDYCGITEMLASCEAVRALDVEVRTCSSGSEAACNARGAMCETVNRAANRCTYACTSTLECPSIAPCGGPDGAKYCGGS